MFLVGIVDSKTLSEFSGCRPNNVIFVCVIRGFAPKNIHTDRAFLDLIGFSIECLLDDVLQELNGSPAGAKPRIPQNQLQLLTRGCCNHLKFSVLSHFVQRTDLLFSSSNKTRRIEILFHGTKNTPATMLCANFVPT
jgi:hypothetical protein